MRASLFAFRPLSAVAFLVVATLPVTKVACQCTTQWVPREGVSGVDSSVRATKVWDADGAGPLPPVLVVAGRFTVTATGTVGNHVAAYDPVAGVWSSFGTGMNDVVHALATLPNGDLVAGGAFTSAGGVAANRIARWNGTAWQPLGAGTNDDVLALTTLPNGDVVAGGEFVNAGGAVANRIARWDGLAWSPLGTGMDAPVRALTTMANGDVVAGGAFTTAGGSTARRIAHWNGAVWSWMGGGANPNADGVFALITLANGDVIAGGTFSTMGSVPAANVARWSGASWSPIGAGHPGVVRALATLPNGDLVANGSRWNGSTWSTLGFASLPYFWPDVYSLTALPNGDLVSAGDMPTLSVPPQLHLARWNGTTWSPLASDFDGPLGAMVTMPNGHVVVSGSFFTTPGAYAYNIALWNGASWSAVPGPSGNVRALTTLPNGDLIVIGQFGGASVHQLAVWNGTNWSPLGPGMTLNFLGGVNELVILPNGDWIIGGSFTSIGAVAANNIARWNGTTWSPLGAGTDYPVTRLVVLPNGDVVAGGLFTTVGGVSANKIARWDGVSWSALGSGMGGGSWTPGVYSLLVLPNGDLVAGGDFTVAGGATANNVARWDGSNWQPLGAGTNGWVGTLTTLPNGDLVASGSFTSAGGVAALGLARWNGTAWAPLAPGTNKAGAVLGSLANGDLLVSGLATTSGAVITYLARLTTTCPALAVPAGNGCAGSGGANVLAATTLPWIGSTFRATATGMPANGLAVGVFGLGALNTPLSAILPQGLPGCTLLATPDLVFAGVPSAGTLQTDLAIPNTIALATQSFREQVVALELSGSGAITAVTSTNALALTIGAF